MADDDRTRWQARYRDAAPTDRAPDPWLVQGAAPFLPTEGTALDLAGGTGRHARWLAARGLRTTVLDIAPAGLDLAVARAAAEGLRLEALAHDLDDGLPDGTWDVVLVSWFLVRPLFPRLHRAVAPGGVLVLLHPTVRNLERHRHPSARWCLDDGELTGLRGLDTLHLEEGWGATGHHEVRYVGRRPT